MGDYIIQVGAYAKAVESTLEINVKKAIIAVAVDCEGELSFQEFLVNEKQLDAAWVKFQARLETYQEKYPSSI